MFFKSFTFAAPSDWPDFTLHLATWQDCPESSQTSHVLALISDTESLERYPAAQLKKERDENTYFMGSWDLTFVQGHKNIPADVKKEG